jgi:hypothetical protein
MEKMHQSVWFRSIWGSFLSALIPIIVLAVFSLCVFATSTPSGEVSPEQMEQIQSEDGGLRGAAVILMFLPPTYLVLAAAFFVVGNLLALVGIRTRGWFVPTASAILFGTPLLAFPKIASNLLWAARGHLGMGIGFVLLLAIPIVLAMAYWWHAVLRSVQKRKQ